VLAQTFSNLEVVVVVDGPERATEAALNQVAGHDERMRVITLGASVGGAEARNVGIRAARGHWVALLDDDDEWLPQKIQLQLARAIADGDDRTLVVCKYICRSTEASDCIRPRRLPRPDEPFCEYMFDILCYFQTSTFFCSRSLFLRVPFQNALGGFQDIDWLLHASLQPGFRVIALPEILSVYHTPETRATITSTLAWDKRLAWGQINRALMSGRTYSRFIVGSCVGRAVEERGGYRALLRLLREYLFVGTPTFSGTLLFLGMWAVTPRARRRIRNAFFLSPATNA
jgi:glycosyltransferase involved in cell wall biosynthesis